MSTRILIGDVRERLAGLPDESVHCVVTSPPYFGLRDYGTASWDGGDPDCDHASVRRGHGDHEKQATSAGTSRDRIVATDCRKCGATRVDKQIGLEPTPAAFVAVMVDVFRDVRRVLRNDGTLWLNLGDSYAGSWGAQGKRADGGISDSQVAAHPKMQSGTGSMKRFRAGNPDKNKGNSNRDGVGPVLGLKPKDLIGIPWRVAFALQADGWYLRQDIIWSKPNPMPESVTDRCTKAHEYLFLLSKSARYHFDAAAIAEDAIRAGDPNLGDRIGDNAFVNGGWLKGGEVPPTRNRRSVWTVATQPFSEAHFATFPPALIEPCILAGCPKDCCAECGAPHVRETERIDSGFDGSKYGERALAASGGAITGGTAKSTLGSNNGKLVGKTKTLGWSPSCSCNAGTARGVCLDPFGGAGTTGLVADRLGRDAILIELNPEYADIADRRINADAGMFAKVAAERAAG